MNDYGRQVLIDAQLRGVRQVKKVYRDRDGRCALGLLLEMLGDAYLDFNEIYGLLKTQQQCQECGMQLLRNEKSLIVHLNDVHGYDFLTIARKLPDTESLENQS